MRLLPSRLAILTYHRVLPEPDSARPGVPDAREFAWHLETIGKWFNVLPLEQAVEKLKLGTLPPRALSITFDDGYADNHEVAMPVLRNFGMTATFFVATGYLNGSTMWNDDVIDCVAGAAAPTLDLAFAGLGVLPISSSAERQAAVMRIINAWKRLPGNERADCVALLKQRFALHREQALMMRPEQVRGLSDGGMQIGAHTVSHPILTSQTLSVVRDEIVRSKEGLEDITGQHVAGFAYPNGRPGKDYDTRHVQAVRDAKFSFAVSTAWGAARTTSDVFQLPRLAPWDTTPARFAARILRGMYLQSGGIQVPSPQ